MGKFALKYGIIICVNLFAFFVVGHILDTIFAGDGKYTVVMLIVSIIPMIMISMSMIKTTLVNLEKLDKTD